MPPPYPSKEATVEASISIRLPGIHVPTLKVVSSIGYIEALLLSQHWLSYALFDIALNRLWVLRHLKGGARLELNT